MNLFPEHVHPRWCALGAKHARRAAAAAPLLFALLASLLGGAPLPAQAQAQAGQPQQLPTVTLSAGFRNIQAEVARTEQEHQIGLMHRTSMPEHAGMLFVFEQAGRQCFWMKNTLLPLSIAFLSDDGRIVNIAEMKPQSLESHCSAEPVRFVLEMNRGWFSKRGLKPGSVLKGSPFVKTTAPPLSTPQ